ncbi:AarF/ABC1/UbiB kinase family protein [Candidatus Azambacteria bacterium]|nr:AarF/ABC1/UbiB kinase family protein [Candidatus Azambacteria bacterium]
MKKRRNNYRVVRAPFFGVLFALGRLVATILDHILHYTDRGFDSPFEPRAVRELIQELGGIFVKFGQILAMRPDFLPEAYTKELLKLLDELPSFPYEEVEAIFQEEFGKRPDELFRSFSRTPLSAASLAQVHEATLPDGTAVAVKVLRPRIKEIFLRDMKLFRFLARLVSWANVLRSINPFTIVEEFERWTLREFDMRLEAESMERMRRDAEGLEWILIPRVFPECTSERVLTMTLLPGRALKGFLFQAPEDVEGVLFRFAQKLVRLGLHLYFLKGFFHADPHPANIFLINEEKVGLLDFGIVGEASVEDRLRFAKFIEAGTKNDARAAAESFLELSRAEYEKLLKDLERRVKERFPEWLPKLEEFQERVARRAREEISTIIKEWHEALEGETEFEAKSSAQAFLKILLTANRYNYPLPRSVVLFVRTLVLIDMDCLLLAPRFNIAKEVVAFFEERPELISSLEEERKARLKGRERAWLRFRYEHPEEAHELEELEKEAARLEEERFAEQFAVFIERSLEFSPKS